MKMYEIGYAFEHGYDLVWDDPDPIEGNDYKITSIELGQEISRITYNDGMSEAEVLNSEIKSI